MTSSLQADFVQIMRSLPVCVSDEDIEEMFTFADKDKDGKLSYKEFKVSYKISTKVDTIFFLKGTIKLKNWLLHMLYIYMLYCLKEQMKIHPSQRKSMLYCQN